MQMSCVRLFPVSWSWMSVSFSIGYVVYGSVFLVDWMLVHSWSRRTIFVWIDFSKYVCIFSWLIPCTELNKPIFMAASQVGFYWDENVTCRKCISSVIVICWYAEVSKCVDCCIGIIHKFPLQSIHTFHTTWWFLVANTSLLLNKTLHPSSQSGAILMIKWYCRPVSMWYFLGSFGIYLTRILRSCEFVKVDTHAVPTLIGLVGGILFCWLP